MLRKFLAIFCEETELPALNDESFANTEIAVALDAAHTNARAAAVTFTFMFFITKHLFFHFINTIIYAITYYCNYQVNYCIS